MESIQCFLEMELHSKPTQIEIHFIKLSCFLFVVDFVCFDYIRCPVMMMFAENIFVILGKKFDTKIDSIDDINARYLRFFPV